jgi:hypothetical protein
MVRVPSGSFIMSPIMDAAHSALPRAAVAVGEQAWIRLAFSHMSLAVTTDIFI